MTVMEKRMELLIRELDDYLNNYAPVSSVLGPVDLKIYQVGETVWEMRFANADDSFVLKLYYYGESQTEGPQIHISNIMFKGSVKGRGLSKAIINFLVSYCKKSQSTLWIVDIINREWKMYLISQGAKLVREETQTSGAALFIPDQIGTKKRKHIYNDEFDRELLNYLVQFLTLEGVEITNITSAKSSETVYDIKIMLRGFVLGFQYEKASSAGEAQIRFTLFPKNEVGGNERFPADMLINMMNVLLLYCKIHGSMTLWMFNVQAFGEEWKNILLSRGATMMQDDPAGLYGGTVLQIEKKLQ